MKTSVLALNLALFATLLGGQNAMATERPPELDPIARAEAGAVLDQTTGDVGAQVGIGTDDLRSTMKLDQNHSLPSVNLKFGYAPNGVYAHIGLQRDVPTSLNNLYVHLGAHDLMAVTPASMEAVVPGGVRLKFGNKAYLDANLEGIGMIRNNRSGMHFWETGLSFNGAIAFNNWITLLGAAKIAATYGGTNGPQGSQKQIGVGVRPKAEAQVEFTLVPDTLALTFGMAIADNIAKVAPLDPAGKTMADQASVEHNLEKTATAGLKYIFN